MKKVKKVNWLLIFILILAGFLRIYRLGHHSLWKDEIFSMLEAQRSVVEIFTQKTYFFGYTPLHHFFTHLALYFTRNKLVYFGKSEFIVRFPAVIFGIATIYLIYKLGELLFNKNVGLISAFLLSISPLHLEYSREVRYYSYLIFFSSLTFFFLYKMLLEKKKSWVSLFLLATFLNIMTQATALLVLGAEVIFVLVWVKDEGKLSKKISKFKRKENLLLWGALLILVVLASIFIKSFSELFTMVKLNPAMPFLEFLVYVLERLSGSKILLFFYLAFSFLGLAVYFREKKRELVLLLSNKLWLLLLPLVFPPLILYFFRPQGIGFHIRYVSFIVIPYLLIVSYGFTSLLKRNRDILVALFVLVLWSIQPIRVYYAAEKEDWRGVAEYLRKNARAGDVVMTEVEYNNILLDYYLKAQEKGIFLQVREKSIIPQRIPFRIFFLQHDDLREKKVNPEAVSLSGYEKIVPFLPEATVSPMYLFESFPIWAWQEAEDSPSKNQGWEVSESWGKGVVRTDATKYPDAWISYQIEVPQDGNYDLYANLRWDKTSALLKYKIDKGQWSESFQPVYKQKRDLVAPLKEKKLGSHFLKKGPHTVSFLNTLVSEEERFQIIDYFYLSL